MNRSQQYQTKNWSDDIAHARDYEPFESLSQRYRCLEYYLKPIWVNNESLKLTISEASNNVQSLVNSQIYHEGDKCRY